MSGFIQNVFDAISLERNPKLWTSEDPGLTKKRISLLSEFEETRFSEQIERKKSPIGKNDLLAAFKEEKERSREQTAYA